MLQFPPFARKQIIFLVGICFALPNTILGVSIAEYLESNPCLDYNTAAIDVKSIPLNIPEKNFLTHQTLGRCAIARSHINCSACQLTCSLTESDLDGCCLPIGCQYQTIYVVNLYCGKAARPARDFQRGVKGQHSPKHTMLSPKIPSLDPPHLPDLKWTEMQRDCYRQHGLVTYINQESAFQRKLSLTTYYFRITQKEMISIMTTCIEPDR